MHATANVDSFNSSIEKHELNLGYLVWDASCRNVFNLNYHRLVLGGERLLSVYTHSNLHIHTYTRAHINHKILLCSYHGLLFPCPKR